MRLIAVNQFNAVFLANLKDCFSGAIEKKTIGTRLVCNVIIEGVSARFDKWYS